MNSLIAQIQEQLRPLYPEEEVRSLTRIICCDLLKVPVLQYYAREPLELTDAQKAQLNSLLHRMSRHEPIQYIEGGTTFDGLWLNATPDVLIPRPETAELVHWIVQEQQGKALRILDLGTGSGCIALSLAHRLPLSTVAGCDISQEALQVARANGQAYHLQVPFFQLDLLHPAPLDSSYHLLVSNPPYIAESERSSLSPHVTEWEPALALFVPDEDPLRFYRALARLGQTEALQSGGWIYMEINQRYGKETAALFAEQAYQHITLRKDSYGNDRMLACQKSTQP